jgi:hypothetical protein
MQISPWDASSDEGPTSLQYLQLETSHLRNSNISDLITRLGMAISPHLFVPFLG